MIAKQTKPVINAPAELKSLRQWVGWRSELRNGKPTKLPVNPHTGRMASSTDRTTWGTWEQAHAAIEPYALTGVGFVFGADDPYVGIDLDHVIDERGIVPWAAGLISLLNSYTEYSPSGTGVHIIVRGELPEGRNRKAQIEMYDSGRYFTWTGRRYPGTPEAVNERTATLHDVHTSLFPTPRPAASQPVRPATPAVPEDRDLIGLAARASNGVEFSRLWDGDISAHGDDHSAADMALVNHLAFWCGPDPARIDRLFRQSGLMRPKWDMRRGQQTYGQRTIARVLSDVTEFFSPEQWPELVAASKTPPPARPVVMPRPPRHPIYGTVWDLARLLGCSQMAAEHILWRMAA